MAIKLFTRKPKDLSLTGNAFSNPIDARMFIKEHPTQGKAIFKLPKKHSKNIRARFIILN